MKIQTFSIVAGSEACNARCPFCISKMTVPRDIALKEPEFEWKRFEHAALLAKATDVTTVMITSKGEPTLFPEQITKILEALEPYKFPITELQTNGIRIAQKTDHYEPFLKKWYELGLLIIAVSIVHYDPEINRKNYIPYEKEYINLQKLIAKLIEHHYTIRLTCVLADGFIDSSEKLVKLLKFAKECGAKQLTITPVNKPEIEKTMDTNVWQWTNLHHLKKEQLEDIKNWINKNGKSRRPLSHGAVIYDIRGQNLCLNNCLSVDTNSEEMRNLIFFPNGHAYPDWQYEGSIIF